MNYNCISVVLCLFIAAECINGTSVTTELSPLDVSLGEPWTLKCVVCLSGGDVLGGVNVYHKPVGKTVFEPITRNWKSGNISVIQLDFLLRSKLTWTKDQSTLSLAVRDHWPRDKGVYRCSVTITGKTTPVTDDKQYPAPTKRGETTVTTYLLPHDIRAGRSWMLQCAVWLNDTDVFEALHIYYKPLHNISFQPIARVTLGGKPFISCVDLAFRASLMWNEDVTVLIMNVEDYSELDSGVYRCSLKVKGNSVIMYQDKLLQASRYRPTLSEMLNVVYTECDSTAVLFCVMLFESSAADVTKQCRAGEIYSRCIRKTNCTEDPRMKALISTVNRRVETFSCGFHFSEYTVCNRTGLGYCKLNFETAVETTVTNKSKVDKNQICRHGDTFFKCVQTAGCMEVYKTDMDKLHNGLRLAGCDITVQYSNCNISSLKTCKMLFDNKVLLSANTLCREAPEFFKCIKHTGCTDHPVSNTVSQLYNQSHCYTKSLPVSWCSETAFTQCQNESPAAAAAAVDTVQADNATNVTEMCVDIKTYIQCLHRSGCYYDKRVENITNSLKPVISHLGCDSNNLTFSWCNQTARKQCQHRDLDNLKDSDDVAMRNPAEMCLNLETFFRCVHHAGCIIDMHAENKSNLLITRVFECGQLQCDITEAAECWSHYTDQLNAATTPAESCKCSRKFLKCTKISGCSNVPHFQQKVNQIKDVLKKNCNLTDREDMKCNRTLLDSCHTQLKTNLDAPGTASHKCRAVNSFFKCLHKGDCAADPVARSIFKNKSESLGCVSKCKSVLNSCKADFQTYIEVRMKTQVDEKDICTAGNKFLMCVQNYNCDYNREMKLRTDSITDSVNRFGCTLPEAVIMKCNAFAFASCPQIEADHNTTLRKMCRNVYQHFRCSQQAGCVNDPEVKDRFGRLKNIVQGFGCDMNLTVYPRCTAVAEVKCHKDFDASIDAINLVTSKYRRLYICRAANSLRLCLQRAGCSAGPVRMNTQTWITKIKNLGCYVYPECSEVNVSSCKQNLKSDFQTALTTLNNTLMCRAGDNFLGCMEKSGCFDDQSSKPKLERIKYNMKHVGCNLTPRIYDECDNEAAKSCFTDASRSFMQFRSDVTDSGKVLTCRAGEVLVNCLQEVGCLDDLVTQRKREAYFNILNMFQCNIKIPQHLKMTEERRQNKK